MGNLTGQQIKDSYDGLINTKNLLPIDGTLRALTDGLGNDLPLRISTTNVDFTGTVTGDNNTTYDLTAGENLPDAKIILTGSDGTTDEVILQAGTNITLNQTGNTIDISATGGGAGVTYTISAAQATPTTANITLTGSDASTDTITLSAGSNVSLSVVGDIITFAATDTNTTYDLDSVQVGSDVAVTLVGSDTSLDTITLVAGTNVTLTDDGSNNVTIDAAGGGGGTTAIYKPERRFSTTGDNTWNFAMPQNGNNYSSGGFQRLIDVQVDRRFFTEIWGDSISQVAVLCDDNDFDGILVAEIWDAHPETGMPKDRLAISQNSYTNSPGQFQWQLMDFLPGLSLGYAHRYVSVKAISGSLFQGIYAAVGAGANIGRLVEFDTNQSPPNQFDAVSYVGGMYDGQNQIAGAYPLNYQFGYRIDMFPNVMFKE